MAFSGVSINSNMSVAGRSAVYIGATTSSFTSVPTSMFSVGAVEGAVSLSPNQDIIKLNRSDAQSPYAVIETAYDIQLSFNLQETDVFNLALACGYNTSAKERIQGSYDPGNAGHHGILRPRFAQKTAMQSEVDGASGSGQISSLASGTGANPAVTITLDDLPPLTEDDDLIGLDAAVGTRDYVVLSGITSASFKILNGQPLEVTTAGTDAGDTQTVVVTPPTTHSVGASLTDTADAGLGRLRRIQAIDSAEYTHSTKILTLNFAQSTDLAVVSVGDTLTLRDTSNLTDYAFLKELNGYPLIVSGKAGSELTFNIESLTSQTANVAEVGTDDNSQVIGLGFVDSSHQLVLGSDSQSSYRSMLIRVEGGQFDNLPTPPTGLERQVAEWQFYKVKLVYGGSVDYERTGAVTYPVTAHCLSNNSDVVGRFITPSQYDRSNDYGDS